MTGLDEVADELYGLRPADFTRARDARAAEARRAGDRLVAEQIKRLRRPTTAAWLVNLLARTGAERLGQLIDFGDAMRAAQAGLAAEDVRRLSHQRHQVVVALAGEVKQLAADAGVTVSEQVAGEVQATLEAALADPQAAEAVRRGRLATSLSYTGLGPVDLSGAVAVPAQDVADGDQEQGPDEEPSQDKAADEEKGRRAERAVAEAKEEVAGAEAEVARRRQAADEARRRLDEHLHATAGLERNVAEATAAADDAARRLEAARASLDEARTHLD